MLNKDKILSIALSELMQSGWLEINYIQMMQKKRVYELKNLNKLSMK